MTYTITRLMPATDPKRHLVRASAPRSSQPKDTTAPCSWTLEESKIESCKHQDNADVDCQPFPESASEEQEIYTDYDGYHRCHVKRECYSSVHSALAP